MDSMIYTIQAIICVCAMYYCYKCCLTSNNIENENNENENNENEIDYLTSDKLPKYRKIDTLLSSNNNYKTNTILPDLPKYDDIV
jgi:hypothetical protein